MKRLYNKPLIPITRLTYFVKLKEQTNFDRVSVVFMRSFLRAGGDG